MSLEQGGYRIDGVNYPVLRQNHELLNTFIKKNSH